MITVQMLVLVGVMVREWLLRLVLERSLGRVEMWKPLTLRYLQVIKKITTAILQMSHLMPLLKSRLGLTFAHG